MTKQRKQRKRPRITRRRLAGRHHAVVTVEGGTKGRGYRVEPCAQCPWRLDQQGMFPAEAFRLSAPTAYDAAMSTFAPRRCVHPIFFSCPLAPGGAVGLGQRVAHARELFGS